jgi:hypothetical protein
MDFLVAQSHSTINFAAAVFLAFFIVVGVAAVAAAMVSSRRRLSRWQGEDEGIQDAIDRFDRRQRNNWTWPFWE